MFSWLSDLSKSAAEPDAMWAVISSPRAEFGNSWAALVSALACQATGDFAFEFDSRVGRLGNSVLVRYRDSDLNRMVTKPATVIARVDPPGELSFVRVLIDECDCGAADCEVMACYGAGRFVRRRADLRVAA